MFFRCCRNKDIKTIKIIDGSETEIYWKGPADRDPNYQIFDLEITMKDGSIKKEYDVTERSALWKYGDFLNNPKDENYENNIKYMNACKHRIKPCCIIS